MLTYNPRSFINIYETEFGKELWRFLNHETTVMIMKTAARIEKTPVELIEETLLTNISDYADKLDDRSKKMIGDMIKQIMTANGYVIDRKGVKIPRGFFTKGTQYKNIDTIIFHAYRTKTNGQKICLTLDKHAKLPKGCNWYHWRSFFNGISAKVGFDLKDEKFAIENIERDGYYIYCMRRTLKNN